MQNEENSSSEFKDRYRQVEREELLDNRFKYHSPKPGQNEKYEAIRSKAKELAAMILELVPQSREQSVALTELETSMFWANAGIARNS